MGRAVSKWSGKIREDFSASLVNLRRFISLPDLFPLAPASRPWVSEDVEYLVRSQNVQRNVQVRHQKNKRQGIVWLPVKLEGASQDLLQIVQLVTTKPLEEYDDILGDQGEIKGKAMKCNHTSMRTFRKWA